MLYLTSAILSLPLIGAYAIYAPENVENWRNCKFTKTLNEAVRLVPFVAHNWKLSLARKQAGFVRSDFMKKTPE